MITWELHKAEWGKGCGTEHCARAKHVVLAKGTIPCDVLFIGEAPGSSEDVLGQPFVGPAGMLLTYIVNSAGGGSMDVAYTNVVGCLPRNEEGYKDQPYDDQIEACKPRLEEFLVLAQPRLIVCVGRIPKDWLCTGRTGVLPKWAVKVDRTIPQLAIIHPAAILRMDQIHRDFKVQETIHLLRDTLDTVFPDGA